MEELKKGAGNPQGFQRPEFNTAPKGRLESLDATLKGAFPMPGQSLTQDPEQRLPYEKPPEIVDIQEFIDGALLELSSEEKLPQLLQFLRDGVPVEMLTEKYLKKKFQKGIINPDLLMLAIEPVIYMMIALASYAEIDPVLYPEDPMMDEEDIARDKTKLYQKAAKELKYEDSNNDSRVSLEEVQAPSVVPQSLLARAKEAVEGVSNGD
jgi:hypothetical protein